MAVAISHSRPYVNPVEVGRACANRLMEAEHLKKVEREQEQITRDRISAYEADPDVRSLFSQLMNELGLSCEFINGHGMKVMQYNRTPEESKMKIQAALEGFRQTKVIYSMYDDADLEKMKGINPMLVSEIQTWRKAFPNVVKVSKPVGMEPGPGM